MVSKAAARIPPGGEVPHERITNQAAPNNIVLILLAVLLIALGWFPILKTGAHYDMGPNEGFNAYFQHTVASGGKIYGAPPDLFYANYPPLSFHLVAWLSYLTHDVNLAGRWISVLAWIAIGIVIGQIVWRLTGRWRTGLYAAMCWLVWLTAFDMTRIGFNDPHLLGIALNLAGFYWYVRDPESIPGLRISAILFALSLFTKQTLLAFPAAVAIELWLASRKRFLHWVVTAAASCVVLLVLAFVIDGSYFLDHLRSPRTYAWAGVTSNTVAFLTFAAIPFAIALIWVLRNAVPGPARVLVWSFGLAYLSGMLVCSGEGAGVNHFFDAMIATVLVLGVSVGGLLRLADGAPFPRVLAATLLIVPPFLSSILVAVQRLPSDLAWYGSGLRTLEAGHARAVEFIRAQPGPALCENLLLCYEAGKPETYDAFAVDQAIRTGRINEGRILQMLASRHWGVVELQIGAGEPIQAAPRERFSAAFMNRLLANYRPVGRNSQCVLLVPKPVS
jgi:hypothetical protein